MGTQGLGMLLAPGFGVSRSWLKQNAQFASTELTMATFPIVSALSADRLKSLQIWVPVGTVIGLNDLPLNFSIYEKCLYLGLTVTFHGGVGLGWCSSHDKQQ